MGGERARLGEFPHQALLGYPSETNQIEFKCGGSLISKRFVLTAAHCSKGVDNPTVVRLAELDLAVEDDDQVDFDVEQIIKHPKYSQKQAYNDIALVKLAQDVLFTKMLRPACLWAGREINTTQALATGFGHTEYGESHFVSKWRPSIINHIFRWKILGPINEGSAGRVRCVGLQLSEFGLSATEISPRRYRQSNMCGELARQSRYLSGRFRRPAGGGNRPEGVHVPYSGNNVNRCGVWVLNAIDLHQSFQLHRLDRGYRLG